MTRRSKKDEFTKTRVEMLAEDVAKLARALDPKHGIVGRRNSRAAIRKAMNALRRAIDEDFPCIRSSSKPRKQRAKTYGEHIQRMRQFGWIPLTEVHTNAMLTDVLVALVPTRVRTAIERSAPTRKHASIATKKPRTFVPIWVKHACDVHGHDQDALRKCLAKCRKDLSARRAVSVLAASRELGVT